MRNLVSLSDKSSARFYWKSNIRLMVDVNLKISRYMKFKAFAKIPETGKRCGIDPESSRSKTVIRLTIPSPIYGISFCFASKRGNIGWDHPPRVRGKTSSSKIPSRQNPFWQNLFQTKPLPTKPLLDKTPPDQNTFRPKPLLDKIPSEYIFAFL